MLIGKGDCFLIGKNAFPDMVDFAAHISAFFRTHSNAAVPVIDHEQSVQPAGNFIHVNGEAEMLNLKLIELDRVFDQGQQTQRRDLTLQQFLILLIGQYRVRIKPDILDLEEIPALRKFFL